MATDRINRDYEELFKHFGEEKIRQRYEALEKYLKIFIGRSQFKDKVRISYSLLNQAVVDYFADIDRLKDFHNIEKANYIKIHAYSAYWLLRRKPIQVIKDDDDGELAFINENFVASYLLQFLRGEDSEVFIKIDDKAEYDGFVENLKYFLRYRTVTAKMLETFLESYQAGRAFERAAGITGI